MNRIVHFESLLMTGRAVKHVRRIWVRVHPAGRQTDVWWIEFFKPLDAKKAAGSLLVHIREKVARGEIRSDGDYNRTIVNWIDQLAGMGYIRKHEKKENVTE